MATRSARSLPPIIGHGRTRTFSRDAAHPMEAAMAIENRNQLMTAGSKNFAEGMRAFLEKRKPEYTPE